MIDKNGVLSDLLRALRQKAASEVCQMLRDIADDLESDLESEPLETMQEDSILLEFETIWADR